MDADKKEGVIGAEVFFMKSRTSVIIGTVILIIAGGFMAFAMQHPELSFPWSQRVTFMLYGAYIWFIFRFLIDIPVFRRNREKIGKSTVRAVIFFMMAVVFLAMEMTGDTVNIYTIIRGFIVVGACDVAIENTCKKIEKGESADEKE